MCAALVSAMIDWTGTEQTAGEKGGPELAAASLQLEWGSEAGKGGPIQHFFFSLVPHMVRHGAAVEPVAVCGWDGGACRFAMFQREQCPCCGSPQIYGPRGTPGPVLAWLDGGSIRDRWRARPCYVDPRGCWPCWVLTNDLGAYGGQRLTASL